MNKRQYASVSNISAAEVAAIGYTERLHNGQFPARKDMLCFPA